MAALYSAALNSVEIRTCFHILAIIGLAYTLDMVLNIPFKAVCLGHTNNGVKWGRFIVPKKVEQINDH